MKYSKLVGWVFGVGLLSACTSVMDRRVAAHQATWRGLSAIEQRRLVAGQVLPGDTEERVLIALGPPDKVLPFANPDGRKQIVWIYDLLEFEGGFSPFDPNWIPHLSSRERSVIFQDGVVTSQAGVDVESIEGVAAFRASHAADYMVTRLNALVGLTSLQKAQARDIFRKANTRLFALSPDERPVKGMPIRVKMRADIRALLTIGQQAKYDAAPQHLGGGSTKRQ